MLIIHRPQTNPYFNIAAEEYLLKTLDDDCFMLWQNEPSIIVGKHQNTLAEINYQFASQNNIPVIRRISGGGTVFHDLGNLNFSFIQKGERGKLVDFHRFIDPIIEVLNQLGVPATFEGKNDIRVKGLKISGNAEHVHKNKMLHHGTLLFSSKLDKLNHALKSNYEKFSDKAVQSVRSQVANISDFLKSSISIEEFEEKIIQYISTINDNITFYNLTDSDIKSIEKLVDEKYKTWKWNFGYSPDFKFNNNISIDNKMYNISLCVQKGIITDIQWDIEPESREIVKLLNGLTIGELYHYSEIKKKLENRINELYSMNFTVENVLKILF